MAFFIRPNRTYCVELGMPELAHVPGIWSRDWVPEIEAIDYLIARATGSWNPAFAKGKSEYAQTEPLSERTMISYGNDLTNFFDWCEARSIRWQSLSYNQLVKTYQGDMLDGRWSKTGDGFRLAPETINRRMLIASEFLLFCAGRNLRPDFEIPRVAPRGRRWRSEARKALPRVGRVRQDPRYLRLPTKSELSQWMSYLRQHAGRTPYLMSKSVVRLGLRAEEVCLLRLDQLPEVPKDDVAEVSMLICYGTKGGREVADIEQRGKTRNIVCPVDFLKELHGYATGHRKLCLYKFPKNHPQEPVPKELFLSKKTGRKISYSRFYEYWKSGPLPYPEWSPHLGRHAFACHTLIDKIQIEVELASNSDSFFPHFVAALGDNLVRFYLQPQLGHIDEKTTELYLTWIREHFSQESYSEKYWDFLNG